MNHDKGLVVVFRSRRLGLRVHDKEEDYMVHFWNWIEQMDRKQQWMDQNTEKELTEHKMEAEVHYDMAQE